MSIKITYKEFFEKSKDSKLLQKLIYQCFISSIKMTSLSQKVFSNIPKVDSGELMLNGIAELCKLKDIILTKREDITAEYMADILNSYTEKEEGE